ncbi:hypothetical protein SAMN05660841_01316 [Sphingobacterium nematocida]|uniref:Uncharacterized protein n=1 Tax=Sphingobacterium nematocida TaxID=1513896 RepID=A0A1T5CH29_9SPHI|nr:hypothetical protein SAMN05660841_01316 [Sphingobacterium nematocida]
MELIKPGKIYKLTLYPDCKTAEKRVLILEQRSNRGFQSIDENSKIFLRLKPSDTRN